MNRFTQQLLPFCSLIFIFSLCTFLDPDHFLTADNLIIVLCRSSVNGIMAAGMTYIIITGGIDLSVGSMLAMCGMIGSAAMLFFSTGSFASIASSDSIIAPSNDFSASTSCGGILPPLLERVVSSIIFYLSSHYTRNFRN